MTRSNAIRLGRGLALAAGLLAVLSLAGCGSAAHSTVPASSRSVKLTSDQQGLRYITPTFSRITTTRNLTYGEAQGRGGSEEPLTLDLYQPSGDTIAHRPAIVFIHGGDYCCGSKRSGPATQLARGFAHVGYVTVSIDYRLLAGTACVVTQDTLAPSCESDATAAANDAEAAVRWLRAQASRYRIDGTRIAVAGDSAGAVAATLVGLNGPRDGSSGNPGYSSDVSAFMSLSGGLPSARLGAISSRAAPGLLLSGTADSTVPYQWSTQTTSTLLSHGVPATLISFAGAGHDPYYAPYASQINTESAEFFYIFMDLAHAEGSPSDAAAIVDRAAQAVARRNPGLARALALFKRRDRRAAGSAR